MPVSEVLLLHFPRWLLHTDTVAEKQVSLVLGPVYGIERALLHLCAEPFAKATADNWLELLEVCHKHREGGVWLLLDTSKETLPLSVLILARLIAEKKIDTPQG